MLLNYRITAFLQNLAFCLSPHWFLTEGSPHQNLRTNTCFLLSGSDLPITELEFSLAANWVPDVSAPKQKVQDIRITDRLVFCPFRNQTGTSAVESCRTNY